MLNFSIVSHPAKACPMRRCFMACLFVPYLLTGVGFVVTHPAPCWAQELDQLSRLLQSQTEADPSVDELPVPPDPSPEAEEDAQRRIYLGLEAEETPNVKGLRVATITRDSPAWKAGFQEEDRIVGINGFAVNDMNDMVNQLGRVQPGQPVNFLINRTGRTRELTAVVISQAMAQQIMSQTDEVTSDQAWVGLTVHDLTPSFREQFGIAAYRGAAVSQVVRGSPAHRAGIQPGDGITEIDARPIESASDFRTWLESARPGDLAMMFVYRGIARLPLQVVVAAEPRPQPTPPTFRRAPIPPVTTSPRQAPEERQTGRSVDELPPSGPDMVPPPEPRPVPLDATPREQELMAEIERLRQELAEAQIKLTETRQQLNNILRALRD